MRWLATLVAMCGCNQTFGLVPTELVDASLRADAPPDAPPMCPPIGSQLRVTGVLTQVVRQNCYGYSASVPTHMAVATCYQSTEITAGYKPYEGRLDDTLGPIKIDAPANGYLDNARISPEGDEVYFRVYVSTGYAIVVYHRDADGTWRSTGQLPIADTGTNYVTTVTRRPQRHIIVASGSTFVEYAEDGAGNWPQVGSITYAALGITIASNPTLTADGLRLVFAGYPMGGPEYQIMYTERAEITGTFGPARPILDMPSQIYDVYLPEDCSRLYFIALGSVFSTELTY